MSDHQRRTSSDEARLRAERDLNLIRAYRSGRREAFDELVSAYDLSVRRIILQLSAVGADLEDLTQDVFLRVYRNLHHFREQSSFYTWLYRITCNVFFDYSKRHRRAEARMARLQSALADASTGEGERGDPERAALNALTEASFAAAVEALPEPFRDVVALRELDDLSYEEIALITGVSLGTVRSRLSRARMRLKTALGPVLRPVA